VREGRRCFWVGIVGPDGSGKSTIASHLVDELRDRGLEVVQTHGRPQSLVRRVPPPEADPTAPHAGAPRHASLSVAKYLLAAADFLVSRRRIGRRADVWVSERPLVDYQVDPTRYQLAPRTLGLIRRLNRFLALPDRIVLLDGDARAMAARKPELSPAEIDRQLAEWRRVQRQTATRVVRLETTGGVHPMDLAREVAKQIVAPKELRWRHAPVKPGRLDVRFAGSDVAALNIYRPIRGIARTADLAARVAVRRNLTPLAAEPDAAVAEVLHALESEGERFTGVSAMASSAPGRWILGLARGGRLQYVAKLGPQGDVGLAREVDNLARLCQTPIEGLTTPRLRPLASGSRRRLFLMHAETVQLAPVTDIDGAIGVATALARAGWTHGDLAPWNLFHGGDGCVRLLDWESAHPTLRPLADMVHFLLRLGATTHEPEGRAALEDLAAAHRRFDSLFAASGITADPRRIAELIRHHLDRTQEHVMSPREGELRSHLRRALNATAR
jgi:hypothetical protein